MSVAHATELCMSTGWTVRVVHLNLIFKCAYRRAGAGGLGVAAVVLGGCGVDVL